MLSFGQSAASAQTRPGKCFIELEEFDPALN
jgi:hypothetical protein